MLRTINVKDTRPVYINISVTPHPIHYKPENQGGDSVRLYHQRTVVVTRPLPTEDLWTIQPPFHNDEEWHDKLIDGIYKYTFRTLWGTTKSRHSTETSNIFGPYRWIAPPIVLKKKRQRVSRTLHFGLTHHLHLTPCQC